MPAALLQAVLKPVGGEAVDGVEPLAVADPRGADACGVALAVGADPHRSHAVGVVRVEGRLILVGCEFAIEVPVVRTDSVAHPDHRKRRALPRGDDGRPPAAVAAIACLRIESAGPVEDGEIPLRGAAFDPDDGDAFAVGRQRDRREPIAAHRIRARGEFARGEAGVDAPLRSARPCA